MHRYRSTIGLPSFFFARVRAHTFETFLLLAVFSTIFPTLLSAAPKRDSADRAISDLRGSDIRQKYAAIEALRDERSRRAADAIAEALGRETDPHLRLALLDALAAQGSPAHGEAVRPLLSDPLPAIRQRAAQVLGLMGAANAEDLLIQTLAGEKDPAVKAAALRSLGLVGTEKSLSAVQGAAGDADPSVRAQAQDVRQRLSKKAKTKRAEAGDAR
jgi:HEAT repeat protein